MKYFTYQWRLVADTSGRWIPNTKAYKTRLGAAKAAEKWRHNMVIEGCEVVTDVFQCA